MDVYKSDRHTHKMILDLPILLDVTAACVVYTAECLERLSVTFLLCVSQGSWDVLYEP